MQLLGMTARVAGQELKQKVINTWDDMPESRLKSRVAQAKIIAENLSQLKGAAMKAGQLLSLDAADYFPPEAIEILSKLQASAEAVDFAVVENVLKKELGTKRLQQFKNIESTPAASASIGQVHKAELDGNEVAIKVQYPGVADSIDSDLALLEKVAKSLLTVTGRKINLSEAFEELKIVLHAEADYENELRNMQTYRDLLKDDRYIVPKPIPEFSTARVLTMSWEDGQRVQDWLKTNPSRESREAIGKLVLELYNREFYEWGFVQTDPNYANFLIRENPLRLIVLDFGATLSYDKKFRSEYKKLLSALGSLDKTRTVKTAVEWGLLDSRESDETKDSFFQMLLVAMEPFRKELQPFRFSNKDYAKRTREVNERFARSLRYTAPPRQLFFLHRKLGGIFTLLKKLDVELDLIPYWQETIGSELAW